MHRGVWFGLVVLLLSMGLVSGATPANYGNVCGSTPDSLTGRGGVALCNVFYGCGLSDGVCPEDFYSSVTEQQGSCSGCPDPDCTATLGGTVRTEVGELIPDAVVYAFYDGPTGTVVQEIATTDSLGRYSSSNVPSGFLSLYVEYEDYESPTETQRIVRGSSHTQDFALGKGSCNSDCTGTISNRCQASCQGVNNCAYQGNAQHSAQKIATLCDQRLPGERVLLEVNGNQLVFADCCSLGVSVQTRNQVNLEVDQNVDIANLVSYIQRARMDGEQVQFVITTWSETE